MGVYNGVKVSVGVAVSVGVGVEVKVGVGWIKVKELVRVKVPLEVETITSTVPAACAGVVQDICVEKSTLQLPREPPKSTVTVPPDRLVPLILTGVPPVVGPLLGVMLEIVGGEPAGGATTMPEILTDPRMERRLVETISNAWIGISGRRKV